MRRGFHKNISYDVISLLIIVAVSLCVGLLLNYFRSNPLPLVYQTKEERLKIAISEISSNMTVKTELVSPAFDANLSLDQFQIFIVKKQGLVIDARPEIFYEYGHVPGAVSLPREDFKDAYSKLKYELEINKDQRLVVYCFDISCEDSKMVQLALINLGYSHVSLFHGGWAEWTGAGLPIEKRQ